MLGPRTRSDPATPTATSPGARPPRPRSNRESGSNEPGVRANAVRPAPQRPRCLRAGPGPSVLPTMQDPLTTSRPSRGRPICIDARSGANGATLAAQFAYRLPKRATPWADHDEAVPCWAIAGSQCGWPLSEAVWCSSLASDSASAIWLLPRPCQRSQRHRRYDQGTGLPVPCSGPGCRGAGAPQCGVGRSQRRATVAHMTPTRPRTRCPVWTPSGVCI